MAERMSEIELKYWRDQIRFAKREWTRQGLIGSGPNVPSTMRLLIEFYRGQQWVDSMLSDMGLELDMAITANKIFPVANALMGQIASRNPRAQVHARNEDSQSMAVPVEHLLNYDIQELKFKRQTNKALMMNLFASFGVVRHGFTPSEEFETEGGRRMELYRPAKPDKPWIKSTPIWDVLFDPSRESFHPDEDMPYVAFRDVMPLKDIRDNPNMKNRRGLAELAGNVSHEYFRNSRPGHPASSPYDGSQHPDFKDLVEFYTIYDAKERKWFQITLDGLDKPLRDPDDWPIDWETLPVSVLQVNEQIDTPFALPILDSAAPVQTEINKLRTMMSLLVFRLRRLIGVNEGGIDDAELRKIETAAINEIIKFKGMPQEMMQQITSGVFPQELLQYLAVLEEDLREGTGQSKMGRAQRINVETAHEVERVQQGQDVSTGRIVDSFQEFNSDIIRLYMQGRRATMEFTGDEMVKIVGQKNADGLQMWIRVSPEDLHGDYEFEVIHGSTLPRDRDREAEKAGADLTVAMQSPDLFKVAYFARKYLEARGIDPAQGMTDQALLASAVRTVDSIRRNAQVGEEGASGGGGMDPAAVSLFQPSGSGPVQ